MFYLSLIIYSCVNLALHSKRKLMEEAGGLLLHCTCLPYNDVSFRFHRNKIFDLYSHLNSSYQETGVGRGGQGPPRFRSLTFSC